MRLSSPAVATAASPTTASLMASQRVRVTLWFQASLPVCTSISRAISGAPQNTPMMAGTANMNPMQMKYRSGVIPDNSSRKRVTSVAQFVFALQVGTPLVLYRRTSAG
jgi:hypothetical protein